MRAALQFPGPHYSSPGRITVPRAALQFPGPHYSSPGHITVPRGAVICTGLTSISSALILGLFCYCIHFSNYKIPEPHDLRSVLPTAPLCSRDGDGCHFERTAAQWLGVRPGYPQVRDGSVLRWILCVAVGYTDILARHAESHWCPSSWDILVYIIPTLPPVTQWH
jgi:hypothetical protein